MSLDMRTRLLTLAIATLTILLASCSPQTDDPAESPDVGALATASPTATEAPPPDQAPTNFDSDDTAQFQPTLRVSDQESDGTTVVVEEASIVGSAGWLVIHADDDGNPGNILGQTHLPAAGLEGPVEVTLDEPLDPEGGVREVQLWAMLHIDGEPEEEFTWPGTDRPLTRDGDDFHQESFGVTVTG